MEKIILEKLYAKYGNEIYLYLYSLCRSRVLAEDLRQETFCKALLSLGLQHTNMRAWLYMVARNLCLNALKKQQREILYGEMAEIDIISNAKKRVEFDSLDRIIKEERIKVLYQCIAKLDIQKREVLELQYFAGLSLKEIAHLTGQSYENVRMLSSRGKRLLRNEMEVEGYEL